MKKVTQSLALLLAGLTLAASLYACGTKDGKEVETKPTSSQASVVSSSAAETTSAKTSPIISTDAPEPATKEPDSATQEPLTTLTPVTTTHTPLTTAPPVTTNTPSVTDPPVTTPVAPNIPDSAYITCWGDSLTAMGGWTGRLKTLSGLKVYNAGVGGESSATIAARQGADPMVVNNIVIPADRTPVVLSTKGIEGCIYTASGNKAYPLMQGSDSSVNPVYIAGVRGTLKWTGSSYSDQKGTWTFTRSSPGEEVVIDTPTPIRTVYDLEKNNPYLMIIFMGTNGGYYNLEHLVLQHRQMIDHANAQHVIVLGMSTGTAEERAEYEARMTAEFGDHFISLRQYLTTDGLADAGLTPTSKDLSAIAQGEVPPQLLMDTVHYTSACRTAIGNMLYEELRALGIL